ncbi:MAG: 23S rRNA (pseudouridine(1915)-N(3))-methyltransferase RlmH [Gammaproteobacteria bacterium]|nr:MAG: 23S rRNA (pseudouridine(1915)-N(3))-methyltransferase RlmH [Gammaproteobacteria bacterium]
MKLKIIAVGTKMPRWVRDGYDEYSKRMPAELNLQLIEVALAKRGKNLDIRRAIAQEGKAMMEQIKPDDFVVALEIDGQSMTTEKLASRLRNWQMAGQDICLLVGGPDGNAAECKARANLEWSLSRLTLPHPLVRIVLAEQLYRAWSINVNHPYHRA